MIKSMVIRDLRMRYAGSVMGLFWSIIHPLAMVATYTFIFSVVFKSKLDATAGTTNFTIWLLAGMLPWFVFSETVQRSSGILIENKNLITKTLFPSEILPIIVLIANIVNHFITLSILLVLTVLIDGHLRPTLLFIPFYLFLISLFTVGLAWIVSSINVFIRDVGHLLIVVMNIWFFYTPVFYQTNTMSENVQFVLKINPFYHIVSGYRNLLFLGRYPSIGEIAYLVLWCVVIFIIGGFIFKRLKPNFADVL